MSNSRPLAPCRVISVAMSPAGSEALSITSPTCSRKPARLSNSSSAWTSSLRFSSRPGRLGRAVLLPHAHIAGFLEHGLGELARRHPDGELAPALEVLEQLEQRGARLGAQFVGRAERPAGGDEALAGIARGAPQELQGGLAEAALGLVGDALEGEIVVRLMDHAQIRDRVADLGALVEARAADHPIGQAEIDEALLEGAGLEAGAHQDRDVVEAAAAALVGLDLLADEARLLLVVPQGRDAHPLALLVLGPQRLAEPRAVVGDQARGGAQDVAGRAVVALQADHPGAGEVLLEAQDVADLGAAPAVDRLVVVADAGEVLVGLGEQAQPEVLGDVGVLVLVDQQHAEAALVVGEDVGLPGEQGQAVQQEVAEVAGIEGQQALLVGGVELARAPEGEVAELRFRSVLRRMAAILETLDDREQGARRPAARIELGGLDDLLDQAQLVVGIEDREVGLEADQLGVAAQEAGAERVEGAEPQALDALARAGPRRGRSSRARPCW